MKNRVLQYFVAALFYLVLAVPNGSAQNIIIGAGAEDECYDGSATSPPPGGSWCNILPDGSVNVVLDDSFNWYQNTVQNSNIVSPLVLIFGVPVQNLLFPFAGGNPLNGPVSGTALANPAQFVDDSVLPCWNTDGCAAALAAAPDVDVDFPSDPVAIDYSAVFPDMPNVFPNNFPGGFDQGELFSLGADGAEPGTVDGNTNVYDFIGLPTDGGPNSNHITNWAAASTEIPSIVLGIPEDQFITPTGWRLWLFTLDEHDLLGAKDAIQLIYDEAQLPLGTFVVAWAAGEKCTGNPEDPTCGPNYFSMSMTETAMLMPLGEAGQVPEPASLFLLGTGLLAIGRQWRKWQENQKSD